MPDLFDPQTVLDGLKDFQRRTVDHVFDRFYRDQPETRRFLVADEVGLGKTMVARGVIARAIRHLQEHTDIDRIDIVYVCSNAAIARQNVNRLNVLKEQSYALASRLTLLPLELKQLGANEINFVSFTPGTTFDLKYSTGVVKERALIFAMLKDRFTLPPTGLRNLLQGSVGFENWLAWIKGERQSLEFSHDLRRDFVDAIRHDKALRSELEELAGKFKKRRNRWPRDLNRRRNRLIGRLRKTLAAACVEALEPDLVILDEFQRFRDLLGGESEAAELAQSLMNYKDARVLLLSATPYKMLTLYGDEEDNHYTDFLNTLRFLYGDEDRLAGVEKLLAKFRAGLYAPSTPLEGVKRQLERELRSVMVRTERVPATRERDAMLIEVPVKTELQAADLHQARAVDTMARAVGARDPVEYWKSAPYLLNFMKGYDLKRRLEAFGDGRCPDEGVVEALDRVIPHLLTKTQIARYGRIDPANARLRALICTCLSNDEWRLLWIPPSLPYYVPGGVYEHAGHMTKSLVFSSWNVVPDAIAAIVSYEVERRRVEQHYRGDYGDLYREKRPLLTFKRSEGRLDSMSTLLLLYPSPSLATLVDPLAMGSSNGETLGIAELTRKVAALLNSKLVGGLPRRDNGEGRDDHGWYWRTLALRDASAFARSRDWCLDPKGWRRLAYESSDPDETGDSNFTEHVDLFCHALDTIDDVEALPGDLVDVLTELALGSPAVCAARALRRIAPSLDPDDPDLLMGAAYVAEGFRTLFNSPDVRCMLEQPGDSLPYWRTVLRYAIDGNLQATLDEYVHVLKESLGLFDADDARIVLEVGGTIKEALSLRSSGLELDNLNRTSSKGFRLEPFKVRCRYALRFADLKSDDNQVLQRASSVRVAFNSPFRPFILASTSIGQEGLDFHSYCHRIWHWNLPTNPVDMEQREGRVHRYKGHAVRKNVAMRFGTEAVSSIRDGLPDLWDELFALARSNKNHGVSDLYPYWIFDDVERAMKVERHVPLPPFSSDSLRLDALKKALVVYRSAFGQPRQEDLLMYLSKLPEGDLGVEGFSLNLAPW